MADRGHVGPPYGAALALYGWAAENRSFIEGQVALNGGDPDALGLKSFLDIAYSLLVNEYRQKAGMTLMAALEETAEYAAGRSGRTPEEITQEQAARKNAQAMAQLDQMMKGVQ